MDKNAVRRELYAKMLQSKKDDMLHRRRAVYAAKRKGAVENTEHFKMSPNECAHFSGSDHLTGQQRSLKRRRTLFKKAEQRLDNVYTVLGSRPEVGQTSCDGLVPMWTSSVRDSNRCRRQRPLPFHPQIPKQSLTLIYAVDCAYCTAKRFPFEPPNFCCDGGDISLVISPMLYDLRSLFCGNDQLSMQFRKNVRTYNNHFAYTSLGVRYDRELTKNTNGLYTFRVQGQMYHFINTLLPGSREPAGLQLYFYDTNDEFVKRISSSDRLCKETVSLLMRVLANNPYSKFFRTLRSIPHIKDHSIMLAAYPDLDQRRYNLPAVSQVAAIFSDAEEGSIDRTANIRIYSHPIGSDKSHTIKHYFACYDPLQYPLLFSRGEPGWHFAIARNTTQRKCRRAGIFENEFVNDPSSMENAETLLQAETAVATAGSKQKAMVTAREYYCYRLQIRENDRSMLLHTNRLLQQFVVDMYVKIETCRLDFIRNKQADFRTEIFQGIVDSVSLGENQGSKIGRRIILPPSFIGGPRDMRRRYLDAMALVQKYGKPDIFLTMTCNPNWREIKENLKFGEVPFDRPDLLVRVFRAKLELLKIEFAQKNFFGHVCASVYVIEFQKRGMPHAHLLIILDNDFKLRDPAAYDAIVSAELPDPDEEQHLHALVVKHMMHGPCGHLNPNNACMKRGICKNGYPRKFIQQTTHVDDGYPQYCRRDNSRKVRIRRHELDNRWVVPYNPYLLALFDYHMNVEICSTVKLIKYMYKYIYKGNDRVSFSVSGVNDPELIDEIKSFQDGRWVGPPKAVWRIYGFKLNEMYPSVYALQVHVEGGQYVAFSKYASLKSLVRWDKLNRTMLSEFFEMNKTNDYAKKLNCLYKEFPQFFVWNKKDRLWTERKNRDVVGRMVTVNPNEGERYYLRLLLSHLRAPISYTSLLTVNNNVCSSFREAAMQHGFLQSDNYIVEALEEASIFQMPSALRFLFAILLIFCSPDNPRKIWEMFESHLCADYERSALHSQCSSVHVRLQTLEAINKFLQEMGKDISEYHLVTNDVSFQSGRPLTKDFISEVEIETPSEDLMLHSHLNSEQIIAYDLILASVCSDEGQSFFIDGPGGTGKTFLYRALLASIRSQGFIAIAVATSGVAASILPGGRTAHSRFKIPLDFSISKSCQLSKQSSVAKLIIECKLIVWDEASMARKEAVEAFDSMLKDITGNVTPFGGKVVVFGGDFRQTLPVMEKSIREEQSQVNYC